MWEKRDRDRIASVKALFALEKQERKQNVQDSCHLLYYCHGCARGSQERGYKELLKAHFIEVHKDRWSTGTHT